MAVVTDDGKWLNSRGDPTHKGMIKANEQLRDEVVERIIDGAVEVKDLLFGFKHSSLERIDSYFALLRQEYGVDEKSKSKKGNMTIENFSATKKIMLSVAETLGFDERLALAKEMIDDYLKEKIKDGDEELQTLVMRSFEVDKQGNIDAKKIFALKSYAIKHPSWLAAMEIIDESKKVSRAKSYIRFYARESIDEEYKLIALDIAAL